jgi:hypothetical protein
MDICENIRRQFAQLKRDAPGSEIYVVQIFSPDYVLALVIPAGAVGKDTLNPMDVEGKSEPLPEALDTSVSDWGEVRRPMLTMFEKRAASALRVVPTEEVVPADEIRH